MGAVSRGAWWACAVVGLLMVAGAFARPGGGRQKYGARDAEELARLSMKSTNRTLVNNAVWPMPRKIIISETVELAVDWAGFTFSYGGANQVMLDAIARYATLLFTEKKISGPPMLSEWSMHGTREGVAPLPSATVHSLEITLENDTEGEIGFTTEESYVLTISENGTAVLSAPNTFGAMHGLETFSQLLYTYEDAASGSDVFLRPTSIEDAPRFQWRGLLIDTSRHYLPADVIYRAIDGMAWSKLNVLHWHIVDGQSFPYDSEVLPLLSQGAYSPQETYSLDLCRDIVKYANDRGVRVVVEFDMPSHAGPAWGIGYPFLTMNCSTPVCSLPTQHYQDPCCDFPFDPSNEEVYALLDQLIAEVSSVFPDQFLHMGGDEVSYNCWLTQSILQWAQQNGLDQLTDVEQYFLTRVQHFAVNNDKLIVNWEEVFTSNYTLQPNTIIEVWKDSTTLNEVVASGLGALLSYGWYLDHLDLTWEDFYSNEPFTPSMTDEMKLLVHGGEACMWAETVDFTSFDVKVWPRAAAAAERLWSPEDVNIPFVAMHRLQDQRCRLVHRGINASPIMPGPQCPGVY